MSLRRKSLHSKRERAPESQAIKPLEDHKIFALIVEVEKAADSFVGDLPVIALCDFESRSNWVSQKFVDYISKSNTSNTKPKSRVTRRGADKTSRINIRWTCRVLGQQSEEGTFLIKPKANFKIVFGCGYNIKTYPSRVASQLPLYSRFQGKTQERDIVLSEKQATSFERGIEDGILLPLERLPTLYEPGIPYVNIAELEMELSHVFQSYTTTQKAIGSAASDDRDSLCGDFGHMSLDTKHVEITSFNGSCVTDDDDLSSVTPSNALVSKVPYSWFYHSNSLNRDDYLPRTSPGLEVWSRQPVYQEPQPWIVKMINPENRLPLHQAQAYPRAGLTTETEDQGNNYWIWDENAKNYKHYDEGRAEPVWYNPPLRRVSR
jgi:hypothetical protein